MFVRMEGILLPRLENHLPNPGASVFQEQLWGWRHSCHERMNEFVCLENFDKGEMAAAASDVRGAFLDVLAAAYPEQHAALIREVAGRVVRSELDLTITPRCLRCRRHHDEVSIC